MTLEQRLAEIRDWLGAQPALPMPAEITEGIVTGLEPLHDLAEQVEAIVELIDTGHATNTEVRHAHRTLVVAHGVADIVAAHAATWMTTDARRDLATSRSRALLYTLTAGDRLATALHRDQ